MPVDTSMYSGKGAATFDAGAAFESGLGIRDRLDRKKKETAIADAFKNSTIKNPDGSMGLDRKNVLSQIAGIDPQAAMEYEKNFTAQDAAEREAKYKQDLQVADQTGRLFIGAKDQNSYSIARSQAIKGGLIDEANLPEQYDPTISQGIVNKALSVKDKYEIDARVADRAAAREERNFYRGVQLDEKRQALQTPYGQANTPDDAKKLKDAFEMKQKFDSGLKEMIDLRKNYGAESYNREAVGRGKQLSKDLLLQYKELAKLGVLSQSDEAILNEIIPDDPLRWSAASLMGQDPTMTKLESFKKDSDRDFETRIGTRTRAGIGSVAKERQQKPGPSPEDQAAVEWAMQNPKDPRAVKILERNGVQQAEGGR